MENQSYTYMWGKDAEMDKSKLPVIKSPTIRMTNLKSQYKPYIIFEPGVSIDPWLGNDFKYSWNHWPVGQLPSDGRVSQFADRPSHNSLSCGAPILHHNEENNSHMAVMLYDLKGRFSTEREYEDPRCESGYCTKKLGTKGSCC